MAHATGASVPSVLHSTAPDEGQFDPSGRYRKGIHIEQSKGIRHVFHAFDNDTGVEVSWQEYWGVSSAVMNLVEKNIEQLKALQHDHIIRYHECWADKKQKKVIFITEAMPTKGTITNVRRFLTRNLQMKAPVLKKWLFQVLKGLSCLHSQDIPWLHRDLRCENIYIRTNVGTLKIGGLEVGMFMNASHPAEFDGTPGFMPPELVEVDFSVQSDIYSFGMLALEMFTCAYPYNDCCTSFQIFSKQLKNELPISLSEVKDADALDLIKRCIAPLEERICMKELLAHHLFNEIATEEDLVNVKERVSDDKRFVSLTSSRSKASTSTAATGSLLTVSAGLPTPSTASASSTSNSGNLSVKCYCSDGRCIRLYYRDILSHEILLNVIMTDLQLDLDSFLLQYIDSDDDKILLTQRTTVNELVEFAKCLTVTLNSKDNAPLLVQDAKKEAIESTIN